MRSCAAVHPSTDPAPPTFSLYGCPSTTSGAMYAHDPTASVRLYLQPGSTGCGRQYMSMCQPSRSRAGDGTPNPQHDSTCKRCTAQGVPLGPAAIRSSAKLRVTLHLDLISQAKSNHSPSPDLVDPGHRAPHGRAHPPLRRALRQPQVVHHTRLAVLRVGHRYVSYIDT